MHDGLMGHHEDFYVPDEPVEDVIAAFEAGEKHLTAPPRGRTETLRIPGLPLVRVLRDITTSANRELAA